MLHRLRSSLSNRRQLRELEAIYTRFTEFTMVPQPVFLDNLRLAGLVRNRPGCVVECGVWKGGMIAGVAALLGPGRHYYLFDSFEGLPPAAEVDGVAARRWQQDTTGPHYHDNCSSPVEFAEEAMRRAGVSEVTICKGWFEKTVPTAVFSAPIALLRLDADWYDSTMVCLDHLYDRIVPGGVIIVDDYYTWDGCSRAVHDFLSRRQAVERIRCIGDVCYLQKADSPANP